MQKDDNIIEKQQDNANPPSQDASAREDTTQKKPESHLKTAGWRIHNEATYRGVDWLLNSAIGVTVAFWAQRTHSGQKYFAKPVEGFFRKIAQPFSKNPQVLDESAKWGSIITSIFAGGTAIIPVMMGLENKKVKKTIVKSLDEKIYGKDAVASDPAFANAYAAIDQEPEKNFSVGMITRVMALTPMLLAAATPSVNQKMMKYMYDPIGKFTKGAAELFKIEPKGFMLKTQPTIINGKTESQSNWNFLHRLIGFDFGGTILYSVMHEFFYKKMSKHVQEQEQKQGGDEKPSFVDKMDSVASAYTDAPATAFTTLVSSRTERTPERFKKPLFAETGMEAQVAL